jgi:hypothetical protein
MESQTPISWLMFFTLAAGVVIAAGVFLAFLRSQRNREIAEGALVAAGPRARRHDIGALPDLVGVFVLALVIMGLLFWGYYAREARVATSDGKSVSQTEGPNIARS